MFCKFIKVPTFNKHSKMLNANIKKPEQLFYMFCKHYTTWCGKKTMLKS